MREKLIDSALLIALVVVCAIIVVTLFFPGRRNRQTAVTPTTAPTALETTQAEAVSGETGGVPVVSSAGQTATPEVPLAETAAPGTGPATTNASGTTTEATVETTTGATTAGESEATPAAEAAQPLPEGAFDLERVGFSFAGAVGACSVPLEAWRHVAVSRDILAEYPCGSEVTVDLAEPVAGRSSFRAVVGDTMNPSNVRTVNIYVAPDEPAFEYGVTAGRLEP